MGLYLPARGYRGDIDFHAPAPGAARPEMWDGLIVAEARDGYGFILYGNINGVGYQSVCVPASPAAYYQAQRGFGALPWAGLV